MIRDIYRIRIYRKMFLRVVRVLWVKKFLYYIGKYDNLFLWVYVKLIFFLLYIGVYKFWLFCFLSMNGKFLEVD